MTNSWDLSGDMSIQKVIRRTVDDERFSIKINYSGTGGYAIMTSPSMSHLESATLSDLNNNNPLGTLEMGVLYTKIPETIKKEIIDKFDGEVVKETYEYYVKNEINKAVKSLGQKDKNKVLYQLKQGNITVDNLQACLDKIGEMKHF